jgi:hypothetical protein
MSFSLPSPPTYTGNAAAAITAGEFVKINPAGTLSPNFSSSALGTMTVASTSGASTAQNFAARLADGVIAIGSQNTAPIVTVRAIPDAVGTGVNVASAGGARALHRVVKVSATKGLSVFASSGGIIESRHWTVSGTTVTAIGAMTTITGGGAGAYTPGVASSAWDGTAAEFDGSFAIVIYRESAASTRWILVDTTGTSPAQAGNGQVQATNDVRPYSCTNIDATTVALWSIDVSAPNLWQVRFGTRTGPTTVAWTAPVTIVTPTGIWSFPGGKIVKNIITNGSANILTAVYSQPGSQFRAISFAYSGTVIGTIGPSVLVNGDATAGSVDTAALIDRVGGVLQHRENVTSDMVVRSYNVDVTTLVMTLGAQLPTNLGSADNLATVQLFSSYPKVADGQTYWINAGTSTEYLATAQETIAGTYGTVAGVALNSGAIGQPVTLQPPGNLVPATGLTPGVRYDVGWDNRLRAAGAGAGDAGMARTATSLFLDIGS